MILLCYTYLFLIRQKKSQDIRALPYILSAIGFKSQAPTNYFPTRQISLVSRWQLCSPGSLVYCLADTPSYYWETGRTRSYHLSLRPFTPPFTPVPDG